ncbi:MAG: DUF3300 domain-containing protein [Candidatus Acidiferrum sp.]
MTFLKQTLAVFLSVLLAWAMMPAPAEGWGEPSRAGQEVYSPVPANDMDALVAPIALYPDALVAQILGAATYPDQVEAADAFVKSNSNLSGEALIQAAEDQEWDPSVMALLQFASVLEKLAQNLGWTSALGDVSANQQADVVAAIQRMRAKAYAAGNLKTGEQIKVVKESPDIIVIQPANPQVVYVPTYNPTVIYGTPVATPGYSTGTVVTTAVISFGVGIAVGAMINNSSCGWGYYGWRMNWAGQVVYCGSGPYYGNPYWWGGYYPGFRPGYRPPYYPPPRPPRPPPVGWRPPPPGTRPPYRPPGGRPPGNVKPTPLPERPGGRPPGPPTGGRPPGTVKPTPLPGNPGGPSIQPVRPGGPSTLPAKPGAPSIQPVKPGGPTTLPAQPGVQPRPTTRPATPPNTRELRGYPATTPSAKPATKPNAFSGSAGGRPESARGNRSLSPPPKPPSAPAKAPSAPARAPSGGKTKR